MADPLLTSLLAFYRNNGTDHSGNGRDLIPAGLPVPSTTTGIGGAANAAMSLADISTAFEGQGLIANSAPPFSLACWIKRTVSGEMFGFQVENFSDFVDAFGITSADGDPIIYGSSGPGSTLTEIGDAAAVDFANAVIVHTGTQISVYQNAVLISRAAQSFGDIGTSPIGIDIAGGQVAFQFLGVWSRVLGDGSVSVGQPAAAGSDIARLYNGGAGFDPTAEAPGSAGDGVRWVHRRWIMPPAEKKPEAVKVDADVSLELPRLSFDVACEWKSNPLPKAKPAAKPKVKGVPKRALAVERHEAVAVLALPALSFSVDVSWIDTTTYQESLAQVMTGLYGELFREALAD